MSRREQDERFSAWMRQHQQIIFKVARSFSGVRAEQGDLAQEIRLAIWRAIPHFTGQSKVSSYVYRIALNRAISWQRWHRSRPDTSRNDGADIAHLTAPETAADPRLDLIYAEIRKLDDLSRSVLLLSLDGFSYQEIADTVGLTVSNVGVRLNRTRKRLADNLKGHTP